ncbi:MAG: DUF3299 domain-containing protein [Alphaproteobacteria bacterium]|nr:DUF3299 domain-containing protein [Alphaproteobacteria bacterium]MBP7757699.1 DUF3299 domain-containing protein [Alphaproteobacteria bacterium]MBP7761101.1 DUF3299 domain-containing protein [Alphaproteobacteria bacterium]MBP7904711.1 DUF3299 domain-containing protein [Alphaproteobacteria bacterium]
MIRFLFLILLALVCCPPVFAIEDWEYSSTTFSQESLVNAVPDFVKTPEGGVSWQLLATTQENEVIVGKVEDGDLISVRPDFSKDVKNLNGQTVVIQGYMFPLEQKEEQTRFLFGPFPMSCPYHYHVGPSMVIEAHAKAPITFSFDALTLTGTFELVPADDEYNVFYRLRDVSIVPPS